MGTFLNFDDDEFHKLLDQVVRDCFDRGLKKPLIVSGVSSNGSTVVARVRGPLPDTPKIIAQHSETDGYHLPIHFTVIEVKTEKTAYFRLEPDMG